MTPAQAFAALAVLLALASWFDWRERRIPNWVVLLTLLAGLAAAFAAGGLTGLGLHAAHMAIALLGGMILFALRVVGAGDAKLYAAAAAWFPLQDGLRLLVSVAMAGLIVLLVWVIARRIAGKKVVRAGNDPQDMLPYGLAIALGAALTALMSLNML